MEKPILFNTEEIKAILEGRKTSTRRVIKPEPKFEAQVDKKTPYKIINNKMVEIEPPYQVEDVLYVRETFFEGDILNSNEDIVDRGIILYAADELREDIDPVEMKWKPSIHMPRSAARIFLKVTDIKVQRLQDITEGEAEREGIKGYTKDWEVYKYTISYDWWMEYCNKHKRPGTWWQRMPETAKEAFKYLWNSYYDWPKCWEFNPYVWAIQFEKIGNYKLK